MPRPRDLLLAFTLAAFTVLEAMTTDVTVPETLAVPVCLAMTLPLVARRRWPLVVVAVVFGAHGLLGLMDDSPQQPQSVLLALMVAAYSVNAYSAQRGARLGLAAIWVGLLLARSDDVIVMGPLMTGVWAVGGLMRDRRRHAAQLAERTAELEREHAEAARQAIAAERARIARELHDVVAHHVSVIVVQAGAERLALRGEQPETERVLGAIEETGRQALGEMRRLLGMLRRDDADIPLAPQPSLDHLEGLVEHVRGAGLSVELTVTGPRKPLAAGVDISAYRVVQEALTNVLKHAGEAEAEVRVAYAPDRLTIEVLDNGSGPNGGDPGHGLAGMRERVAVYGGELTAGAVSGGGFLVRAELPLEVTPR